MKKKTKKTAKKTHYSEHACGSCVGPKEMQKLIQKIFTFNEAINVAFSLAHSLRLAMKHNAKEEAHIVGALTKFLMGFPDECRTVILKDLEEHFRIELSIQTTKRKRHEHHTAPN